MMGWHRPLITTIVVAVMAAATAVAQSDRPGSVVMQPRVLSPAEFLAGDTARADGRSFIPGAVTGSYSAEQDSLYRDALAVRISARSRFLSDTRAFSRAISLAETVERRPSDWERLNQNMAIPPELLVPTAEERTAYQVNIANAMYVPGVLLFPMGTGNLQVGIGDIAKIFGLVEDVSPKIRYVVDETTEVTIVVYSSSAVAVATLFNGIQAQGAYEIIWDGRSDAGRTVANGDYVAEVRLGNQKIMRKRIAWPPQ